jgi:hypothetical protein
MIMASPLHKLILNRVANAGYLQEALNDENL